MESVYHFVSENCVLLLNGSFVQTASSVRYASEDSLYVTVLPLEAVYLPYTVQIIGGKAVTNRSLAVCCDMGENHWYIELKPRYAYVYSQTISKATAPSSAPARLLEFIREGNYAGARTLMSEDLNKSVSDEALTDFFDGVTAVRENIYTPQKGWLLIRSDGKADRCDITVRGGLIENIVL